MRTLLLVLLAGCSNRMTQEHILDVAPGQFLEALRNHNLEAALALTGPNVVFITEDQKNTEKVAIHHALQSLAFEPKAFIDKHHHVARLSLSDHSLVFVRSDGAGFITEIIQFPATSTDETSESIKAYQEAWNLETHARRPLLNHGWTESSLYVDPTAQGQGVTGLSEVIDDFREQFPGAHLTAQPKLSKAAADGWVIFDWKITAGDSTLDGFDVGQVDEQGQLQFISGFFSARSGDLP